MNMCEFSFSGRKRHAEWFMLIAEQFMLIAEWFMQISAVSVVGMRLDEGRYARCDSKKCSFQRKWSRISAKMTSNSCYAVLHCVIH